MSEAPERKTVPVRKPKSRKAKGAEVVKEGAALLPPKGLNIWKWRQRWLVLQKGMLTFYKEAEKTNISLEVKIGDVQSCGRTNEKRQEFALNLDLVVDGKVAPQVVAFETNKDLDEWAEVIEANAPRMLASVPTGFKHQQHLGVAGGELTGLPDQWKSLLENSSITKTDYEKNKGAVELAVEFYSGAAEAKKEEAPPAAEGGAAEKSGAELEAEKILDEMATKGSPWDRYEKGEKLGSSSTGEVFNAADKATKAPVAVKVVEKDGQDRLLVLAEMKKLLENKHKNIANVLEAFLDGEVLYVVLENPKKETLLNIVSEIEMQDHEIAAVCRGVLEGVAHLHSLGIVHRNIFTGSICFDGDYEIKVVDFGYCAQLLGEKERAKDGAPYWTAPEIIQKEPHTEKADVWSLGILMIEMLDGVPPYDGEEAIKVLYKITTEDPPKSSVEGSEVISAFTGRCLAKDCAARPETQALLGDELFEDMATKEELIGLVDGEGGGE